MRLVSDNIFHFRRFLKKHKLNLELTLKKLSATQASIQSFPGEEEDRTENIAVEIQPILSGPINCLTKFVDAEFILHSDVL